MQANLILIGAKRQRSNESGGIFIVELLTIDSKKTEMCGFRYNY